MTRLDPHDGWTPQVREQEQPPVFPEPTEAVRVHAETLPNAPATAPCCPRVETVQWNPYNGVVQCHSCGTIYDARAAREPAGAGLRERIGAVIDRWYHLGLIRFNSRDDGGDDLILRDELVTAALASPAEPGLDEGPDSLTQALNAARAALAASPAEPGLDVEARLLLNSALDHDDYVLIHRNDWSRFRAALLEPKP